ncbi:hypothetical protein ACLB2K_013397 [Fragaria x ananassa]
MSYLGIGFNTLIYNTLIYGYGIAEIFELLEDSLTDRIEVAIAFLTSTWKTVKIQLLEKSDADFVRSGYHKANAEKELILLHVSWSLTAKEQLISPITSVASLNSSLCKRIGRAADVDVSHRNIFVHDLDWDTTREVFISAFEPFGEVEDSNLVMDKLIGKAKGNGFVLFKTCRAALKALREPKKTIGSPCASCQLAFVGPDTNAVAAPFESWFGRKIQGGLGFEKKFGEDESCRERSRGR